MTERNWPPVFLLAALSLKLLLLFALGPVTFPDSGLYVELGQDILNGPAWLHDGGWGTGYAPWRLSRPYGYPLLVAAAKLLAGPQFGLLLGLLQSLASVAVLGLIGLLLRRLVPQPGLQAGLLALCAFSGFALFDPALLTDSFYASLFLVVMLVLALQIAGSWRPRPSVALALGAAWAASLSLRDVGLYHTVLPLVGVLLAARAHRLGPGRAALEAGLFALPVATMVALVVGWNLHRTGHGFFSITGGVNWLWPSFNMADRGLADPFACVDAVCRTARLHGVGRGMEGVAELADAIWADFRPDPPAFGKLTLAHFLGVIQAHPVAFAASVAGNLQFAHLADLAFNPLANLNELARLHSAIGHRLVPGLRELFQALRHGALWPLPLILLTGLPNLAAIAGLAAFTGVTPWRAFAAARRDRGDGWAVLFLWAAAVLFVISYALVHMEMRHAMPAVPLILVAAGWTLGPWWTRVFDRGGRSRPRQAAKPPSEGRHPADRLPLQ